MAADGSCTARPSRRWRRPPRARRAVALLVLVVLLVSAAACGSASTDATGDGGAPGTTGTTDRSTVGTAGVLVEPSAPIGDQAPEAPGTTAAATATVPEPAVGPPAAPPYPIGTLQLDLVDASRPTVSRGVTLAPTRSLPTVIAYPTGPGGPWPLVVFAHGFRLGPPGYTRLVATLTAAGYVVASPSFPLADEAVAGSRVDRGDLPNQPGDVTFVIDQVLGAAADPGSPLLGRVDGSRIGAVGHSDGADTVLEVGYHPTRSDARVRAVVALSPDAVVPAGTRTGASTPLLVEHGDADDVVPYRESVSVFAAVPARRYFLTLVGGGHLEPVTESTAWTPVLDATITAFLDRHVGGADLGDDAITTPATTSAITRMEVAG